MEKSMRFGFLLIKQVRFWMLLVASIVVFLGLLLNFLLFNTLFVTWENLPPLPNGETARGFTDVLSMNRINVLTDQGHYFSCSYRAAETCWIPISREVNHPTSNNPGIQLPPPPRGTRQMVSNSHHTGSRSDLDSGDLIVVAIIRENGQVAFWERKVSENDWLFQYGCGSVCGVLFILLILLMASVVRETRAKLR
jgi:hypothetical protein